MTNPSTWHIRDSKGRFKRQRQLWSLENFDDATLIKLKNKLPRYFVYLPNHHRASKNGMVLRSIAAYELYTGDIVTKTYEIHHINGDSLNDYKENLLKVTKSEHRKIHQPKDLVDLVCDYCQQKYTRSRFRVRDRLKKKEEGIPVKFFCSQKCFHRNGRSESTRQKISESGKKCYAEGRR